MAEDFQGLVRIRNFLDSSVSPDGSKTSYGDHCDLDSWPFIAVARGYRRFRNSYFEETKKW